MPKFKKNNDEPNIHDSETENVPINKSDDNYKKYLDLSKVEIENSLYNTYDAYLQNKYKININYNALDDIKKRLF